MNCVLGPTMAADTRLLRRSWFFALCQWISRFAVVNLLWAGLIVAGLGVAGFFPATIAMFEVIRRWLLRQSDEDVAVLPTAWRSFRRYFWPANAVGYGLALIGYLLYLDVRLFAGGDSMLSRLMLALSLAACLAYGLTIIYLGPVVVHVELTWWEQIRLAGALGLSHPLSALYLVVTGVGLYLVFWQVPGLVVFFGASVLATLAMWQVISISSRQASTAAG